MPTSDSTPSDHARELSKLGASKGGTARAAQLTKSQRSEIARNAAAARWTRTNGDEVIPQATFGAADHPLVIADSAIPCYVLEAEDTREPIRVLVMTGMLQALNISLGGSSGRTSGTRLYRFVISQAIRPFVPDDLLEKVNSPNLFRTPTGSKAYGYEASILADICDVVLESRRRGQLNTQQTHIADQCEILVRGWARVGLAALIDEVTGYQYFRARNALEQILDKFINDELRKWSKTFPDEFYAEMFRLRGWPYAPLQVKKPQVIGHLTNDIIYSRLAPGVLGELQKLTPKDSKGRRGHRFHQRLTEDVGHPKLREHLAVVTGLMRASDSWEGFYRLMQRSLPKLNSTLPMPLA